MTLDYNNFDNQAVIPIELETLCVNKIICLEYNNTWCGTNKNTSTCYNSGFKEEVNSLPIDNFFKQSLIDLDHSGPKIKPFSNNIYNYHAALNSMTDFAHKTVIAIEECHGDQKKIKQIEKEYCKILLTLNTKPVWQDEGKDDCDKINKALKGSWGPDGKFHVEE